MGVHHAKDGLVFRIVGERDPLLHRAVEVSDVECAGGLCPGENAIHREAGKVTAACRPANACAEVVRRPERPVTISPRACPTPFRPQNRGISTNTRPQPSSSSSAKGTPI